MEFDHLLFGTPEMAAAFADEAHVGALLAFEAALARAEARAGIVPGEAAETISSACRVALYDVSALYRDAVPAGTLAIPLVKALTAQVGEPHGRYVHLGATSQDAIDTALMLQCRKGIDLLVAGLREIGAALAALAEQHRRTPMIGRTLLQQALPITFGLKAARWLALVTRQMRRLEQARSELLVVQFGGAVGTLAALGDRGHDIADLLAEELGLGVPDLPWHTERDRIAQLASVVGIAAGAMAKIAGDMLLMAQSEVGELSEASAPGKGGSSAMPHKRNPVDLTFAVSSARLAMGIAPMLLNAMAQEHERGAGSWQVEWSALPELFGHTAGAVERVRRAVAGLEVNAERMRANLDLTGGLVMAESLTMALADELGRTEAFQLVETLTRRARDRNTTLRDVALADERVMSVLAVETIEDALDPVSYLGSTDVFIDRALEAFAAISRGKDRDTHAG